jgi:hypothetical protein
VKDGFGREKDEFVGFERERKRDFGLGRPWSSVRKEEETK